MNKQEAIDAICDLKTNNGLVSRYAVVSIVDQIELQKPVIPKFVADWIELCKGTGYSLRDGLEHIALPSEVNLWLLEEGDLLTYPNQETFARAWLFGYEVEKEKLYTVEIPDPRGLYEHRYLFKHSNGVTFGANDSDIWKSRSECQLTEAEIKEDFEWAWQWAKPVED